MPSLRTALLGLLLAGPATAVFGGVFWACGLSDEGTRLTCVADIDHTDDDATTGRATTTAAVVNGTRFPLDRGRAFTVDLWSPPTEPDFVRLLARATICYRSPDCQVEVSPGPWMMPAHMFVPARARPASR